MCLQLELLNKFLGSPIQSKTKLKIQSKTTVNEAPSVERSKRKAKMCNSVVVLG